MTAVHSHRGLAPAALARLLRLAGTDERLVRGAYIVMEPAARFVLIPLAFASLATGIVEALGTRWGLLRHYRWVVFKLLLNVFAVIVLCEHMTTFRFVAGVAADAGTNGASVRNPSPVVHSVLALLTLAVATILDVHKPQGVTPLGRTRE